MLEKNERTLLLFKSRTEASVMIEEPRQYTRKNEAHKTPLSSRDYAHSDKIEPTAPRLLFPFNARTGSLLKKIRQPISIILERLLVFATKITIILYAIEMGSKEKNAAAFGIMVHSITLGIILSFKPLAQNLGPFLKYALTILISLGLLGFFCVCIWAQDFLHILNPKELALSQELLLWSWLGVPPLVFSHLRGNSELRVSALRPATLFSLIMQMALFNQNFYDFYPFRKFLAIPLAIVLSNWVSLFEKKSKNCKLELLPAPASVYLQPQGLFIDGAHIHATMYLLNWLGIQLVWLWLDTNKVDTGTCSIIYFLVWVAYLIIKNSSVLDGCFS